MILFADDWKYYPGAIVDVNTSNRSFVRMASLYREMGIKNHAFILVLLNPELQGVDPFSSSLTIDQMAAISIECKLNPWYYFREIAKAPKRGGGDAMRLEANRGNIALFWLFFNHITLFLIQIRQTGKSFSADSLAIYLLNILCENTEINLLTKDDDLRTRNIQRLKDIDAELPHYLRQRTKKDTNNTETLSVLSLGNWYKTLVPQKSPKAALNVGRGMTSGIIFIDEPPFQPNIGLSLPAALSACTAARDIAKAQGEPYGTILTTTSGKKDDRDGKFIYKMLSESAEWNEKFLDSINIEDLERTICANSRTGSLRVNCTFNHRQLGKTDVWLKAAMQETQSVGEAADRDYFNIWTSGTMSSPLPIPVMEKIKASHKTDAVITIDKPGNYVTKWYIPENTIQSRMNSGNYVLGLDSSDAGGGDDISLLIMDVHTGETIAAGNYNETNLITFSEWLSTWFVRFPKLTGIIERRSTGAMILDYLLLILPSKGIDPFKRIFNRVVHDFDEQPERFREINQGFGRRRSNIYVEHKRSFGFATSGSGMGSRTDLYSTTLQNAGKKIGDVVNDKTTIDQILGLVIKNGRVDHQDGEHDDMVIAWLLCFWLITQGKNLSFYDIDTRNILANLNKVEITDNVSRYDYENQFRIRREIESLYDELSKEQDDFVIESLERKLRMLNRQLVLREGEIFSLEELISDIRQNRTKVKRSSTNEGNYYKGYT